MIRYNAFFDEFEIERTFEDDFEKSVEDELDESEESQEEEVADIEDIEELEDDWEPGMPDDGEY